MEECVPMNDEAKEVVKNRSKTVRSIVFILYFALLFLLFFVFTNSGMEPFLTFLILLFFLLVMIGPIFYGFQSPYYKKLFQKKKKQQWTEKKPSNTKSKIPKPYTTELKFRKPLIRKCPSCGMTIANFVKKCPQCGTVIMS